MRFRSRSSASAPAGSSGPMSGRRGDCRHHAACRRPSDCPTGSRTAPRPWQFLAPRARQTGARRVGRAGDGASRDPVAADRGTADRAALGGVDAVRAEGDRSRGYWRSHRTAGCSRAARSVSACAPRLARESARSITSRLKTAFVSVPEPRSLRIPSDTQSLPPSRPNVAAHRAPAGADTC